MNGGYDDGYKACECFWGKQPGSLLNILAEHCADLTNKIALDAGCGEGKNAIHLTRGGASVDAFDISEVAIARATKLWPDSDRVNWRCVDIREVHLPDCTYDITVAYGLLHCLSGQSEVQRVLINLQDATKEGGFNVICAFNDRSQDLAAHPGFCPTLLSHDYFVRSYASWDLLYCTDSDLHETHPHNNIPHVHSMTRILARKRGPM